MSKKKWQRTSVQNLLRNSESGRYYGRWKIVGKQKWVALETDVFGVAKLRHAEEAKKIVALRGSCAAVGSGAVTMADLMRTYEERTRANSELAASSVQAWLVSLKKVKKTWPDLAAMKPAQVTPTAVAAWATRFKANGTAYTPPGARTVIRGNSATSVNRAIDVLRRLFAIAIEQGAIHTNPVTVTPTEGRLKKKITKKRLTLPSAADTLRLFGAIENNGARGGWGLEAADFCRFLSYSGCRVGEVVGVTWECVDWEKKLLHVRGYKSDTSDRFLPLFSELEQLLRRIVERRKAAARFSVDGRPFIDAKDRVFRISECQKTIDSACARTGVQRITHHDLRHLFATFCIESGVDIPTVSRWLGHADGGALAMRTYGHLRQDHSQAQAAKVTFAAA